MVAFDVITLSAKGKSKLMSPQKSSQNVMTKGIILILHVVYIDSSFLLVASTKDVRRLFVD